VDYGEDLLLSLFKGATRGSSGFEVIAITHSDDYLSAMNYCIATSSLPSVSDANPYPF
jgi:hypothetical protein